MLDESRFIFTNALPFILTPSVNILKAMRSLYVLDGDDAHAEKNENTLIVML